MEISKKLIPGAGKFCVISVGHVSISSSDASGNDSEFFEALFEIQLVYWARLRTHDELKPQDVVLTQDH
jgi:hypothetical protein